MLFSKQWEIQLLTLQWRFQTLCGEDAVTSQCEIEYYHDIFFESIMEFFKST